MIYELSLEDGEEIDGGQTEERLSKRTDGVGRARRHGRAWHVHSEVSYLRSRAMLCSLLLKVMKVHSVFSPGGRCAQVSILRLPWWQS